MRELTRDLWTLDPGTATLNIIIFNTMGENTRRLFKTSGERSSVERTQWYSYNSYMKRKNNFI